MKKDRKKRQGEVLVQIGIVGVVEDGKDMKRSHGILTRLNQSWGCHPASVDTASASPESEEGLPLITAR